MNRKTGLLATLAVAILAQGCAPPCECTYAEGAAFEEAMGAMKGRDTAYRADWDLDGNGEVGALDLVIWRNECTSRPWEEGR